MLLQTINKNSSFKLFFNLQPSLLRDQQIFTSQTSSTSRIKTEPQSSGKLLKKLLNSKQPLIFVFSNQALLYPRLHPHLCPATNQKAIRVRNIAQRHCRPQSPQPARKSRNITMRHIQRVATPTPPANQFTRH